MWAAIAGCMHRIVDPYRGMFPYMDGVPCLHRGPLWKYDSLYVWWALQLVCHCVLTLMHEARHIIASYKLANA